MFKTSNRSRSFQEESSKPTEKRGSIASTVDTSMSSTSPDFESGSATVSMPSIRDLMEKQAWRTVRKLLRTTAGQIRIASEECPLHMACRYHAPLDVVKAICETRPDLVGEINNRGRTALHIAAAAWNAPDVLKYLVSLDASAASSKDRDLRTPLHLACYRVDKSGGGRRLSENLRRPSEHTVYVLCKVAPNCANDDDFQEMTPIEYAIEYELPLKAIQILRKASESQWKEKSKMSSRRASTSLITEGVKACSVKDSETEQQPMKETMRMQRRTGLVSMGSSWKNRVQRRGSGARSA